MTKLKETLIRFLANVDDSMELAGTGFKSKEQASQQVGESLKIAEQQIKDLILKLINDTSIEETDCAEFYVGFEETCEPEEHKRRSARFFAEMELKELLEQEVEKL